MKWFEALLQRFDRRAAAPSAPAGDDVVQQPAHPGKLNPVHVGMDPRSRIIQLREETPLEGERTMYLSFALIKSIAVKISEVEVEQELQQMGAGSRIVRV